jgi:hypothetical protein
MAGDIEDLDAAFDTESDEYGPGLTFTQAMQELFAGKFSRPKDCAFMYIYAFETACRYFGKWLGNRCFCPCHHSWLEQLDELLKRGSVPIRFQDLLYRLPPKIPDPRGHPCLGYWREEELATALPHLEAFLPSLAGDEADALACVREWLVQASDQPGKIVIGVYC